MKDFFKGIGKGLYNIVIIPAFVVGLAITSVIGLPVFIIISIKKLCLFFTGRSLSNDLPEDIEAKKIIQAPSKEESKVEVVHAVIEDPIIHDAQIKQNPQPQIEAKEETPFILNNEPIRIESVQEEPVFEELPQINPQVKEERISQPVEEKKEEIIETYNPKAAKF